MKRRRILLLLALAAIVAAGLVFYWTSGPKEPAYKGKRLSKWIRQAWGETEPDGETPTRAARETACKAVQSIGTNALPYLVSEFTRPISQWRVSFKSLGRREDFVPLP